jgi:ABC-type maltose transport system permease subunit
MNAINKYDMPRTLVDLFFSLFISGLKPSLLARLGLTEKKLQTLSVGLQQIASKADVLGNCRCPYHFL